MLASDEANERMYVSHHSDPSNLPTTLAKPHTNPTTHPTLPFILALLARSYFLFLSFLSLILTHSPNLLPTFNLTVNRLLASPRHTLRAGAVLILMLTSDVGRKIS